jgi:hypothetical protein
MIYTIKIYNQKFFDIYFKKFQNFQELLNDIEIINFQLKTIFQKFNYYSKSY